MRKYNSNPIIINKGQFMSSDIKDIHLKKDTSSNRKAGRVTYDGKIIENRIHDVPGGDSRDQKDHERLRHGLHRHEGFDVGKYIQTPPILFTRDGHALYLGDLYRGRPAFFIAGGPSFKDVDKNKLSKAGCLTVAINNSVKSFRPDIWICVDDPTHFIKSIWLDPKIMKIVPFCHAEKNIFDNEAWRMTGIKVGDCPNVIYYRRNERFNEEQFLFEDTVNWGNHSSWGGGRSVMLASMRLMFYLGIRRVFLLGVDFSMSSDNKYHFEQDRSKGAIKGNNSTYEKLKERFSKLKPIFEKHDYYIYNCNPNSELKVFPMVNFDDAIEFATKDLPRDLSKERTEGLYDRKAKEKEKNKKKNEKDNNSEKKNKVKEVDGNEEAKKKTKIEIDKARLELNIAKDNLSSYKKNNTNWDEKEIEKFRNDVIEKRSIFKAKEKAKNLAWYGTEKPPK